MRDKMLNDDQIALIIEAMLNKFSEVYLTPKYFGSYPNPYAEALYMFTNGYCAIFAASLKGVIPSSQYYVCNKHIVLKIDDAFYDARGYIPLEELASDLYPINDIFEVPSLLPYDYLTTDKVKFYDDMISSMMEAGTSYINKRGWQKHK